MRNLNSQLLIVFLLNSILFSQPVNARVAGEALTCQIEEVQPAVVTGKVTDAETGEALPGVTVALNGSTAGVATDMDGNYQIEITGENDVLVFSFTGYKTTDIPVNGRASIDVALTQDVQRLDEVVVVGYGTQKKKELTASVSVVSAEDLANRPITNTSQALQGVQGIYVNQESGQPGGDAATIRIRGVGSIGGSGKLAPLVLVDGIEYPIGDVNPADIESISILKDASSTAIYGSRAANGVILITTKKGTTGRLSVDYGNYFGFQEVTYLPDPVDNSADFMELYNQAQINQGSAPLYSEELIEEFRTNSTSQLYPNTNWMDVMFDESAMQEHNLRFSGGTEQSRYNLSLRYLDHNGVLMGTGAKVYTGNLSIQSRLSDRFSIAASMLGSSRNREGPSGGVGAAMNRIMRMVPMQPLGQLEDGRWPDSWVVTPGQNSFQNPVILARESYGNLENNRLLVSLSLNYNILKGLNYQAKAAVNRRYSLTTSWNPLIYLTDVRTSESTRPYWSGTSTKSHAQNEDQTLTLINTLDYSFQLGQDHAITALLGSSFEKFKQKDFDASVQGFPSIDLQELSLGTLNPGVSGGSVADVLMSYFGRIQYSLKDKYLLELSSRLDGSSRFAKARRWGVFPSFSVGWRITEESFMDDLEWVSDLKIRGSWGQIGNQEIGRFQYVNAINLGYDYAFGGNISPGVAITQDRDPDLTWETTTMSNIGLDWELLEGRIYGVAEVFWKRTDGILRTITLPAQVGDLAGPTSNVAVVDNEGFEIGVNHRSQINKSFSYEIGMHLTKISNEVVDLKGETIISNHRVTKEGAPIDSWYVYKTDGLFRTQEQLDNYPTICSRVGLGDVKYVDLNEDGKIDGDDRYIAGSTFPDLTYGFNIGLTYKNFHLRSMWQGVEGIDIYPDHNMAMPFNNGAGLTKKWMTDSWTPQNPDAPLPRITSRNQYASENFSPSDFWLQNASYLRMKNIQLSYRFGNDFLSRIGVRQLELFINGQNLITISNMKDWDPETDILLSTSSSTLSTFSHYPSVKTYTMGVNINL